MNNKAFTLVELIVVMLIVTILATVSFVSYSGYTMKARNSKRISDINNIYKQVELENISGKNLFSFVANSGSRITDNIRISGREGTGISISEYNAGDINIIALGLLEDIVIDPLGVSGYKIGVTDISGPYYEIAGTIENDLDVDIYVKGTWNPREKIKFDRDGDAAHSNIYTVISSNQFNLRIGDTVQINTGKYKILNIKNNKLYLDRVVDPTGSRVYLPNDETNHLIKRWSSSDYPIKEGGRSYVPYLLE